MKKSIFKIVSLVLVVATFFMASSVSVFAIESVKLKKDCQSCINRENQSIQGAIELAEELIAKEYTSKGITVAYEIHTKSTENEKCECKASGIETYYIPCPGPSGHSYNTDKVIYYHLADASGLCDLYLRNIYECIYCDYSYMAPEFYAGTHSAGSAGCPL